MKIQIIRKKGDKLLFVLDGTTPPFANALRRIMISEVPTLAVDWVDFHNNDTVMFDEMLAHRMGLLPLEFPLGKLNLPEECKCDGKGCSMCQVTLVLEKKGPSIAYSGDLKSSNKNVKPTDPKFPIVEILKNQSVKFEAIARLGVGKKHAKWQAANASYQYYPELEITGKCKNPAKIARSCPPGVLTARGSKLVLKDPVNCDLCMKCQEGSDCVKIKPNPNKFIFMVESISGLEPAEIVSQAASILENKADTFRKAVQKL